MKTILTLKNTTQIVMATNHHIDTVITDDFFSLVRTATGFDIVDSDGDVEGSYNVDDFLFSRDDNPLKSAIAAAKAEATSQLLRFVLCDDTPVTGYGIHSGRKFWQLPIRLQNQVKRIIKVK